MAKSSKVSSSISSASKAASVAASRGAASASSSLSSASAKASAAATDAYSKTSTTSTVITAVAIFLTVIAGIAAAVYYSGYADDFFIYWAKKFYKAKAKAEAVALEHAGTEAAQGFLKDQLKKNPVMGEDELEQVSSGLGKEAKLQGLGGVSSKLGGIGKL